MVLLKNAIEHSLWLHCEYFDEEKVIQFRVKIISFRKINLSEIDQPEQIRIIDSNCFFWALNMELINLCKDTIHSNDGPNQLVLIDQEGYRFPVTNDFHIRCGSNFASKSKMNRFYGEELLPKIKAIGAVPFQLPDDDGAIYSIGLKEGKIYEV